MRVAVDLRCLLEPFESGVTVYTKAMVDVLLRRSDVTLDLFYQARKRCEAIHRRYPGVRHLPQSSFLFHLRSAFSFRALPAGYFSESPDLIWLPDRRPFYKTEIPVVLTVHDQVPELFCRTLSWKSRLWHWLFSLKRLQQFCSGFLFPSLTVAQGVRSALPWEVTYEGAAFVKKACAYEPFSKEKFALVLAPLDPRKRLEWVFGLARRFPRARFVCIGLKAQDRRFSRHKQPVLPNVHFVGSVTEAEKKWFFEQACVFLALSSYEGFDLPALEATMLKTPVIFSDISVHRELYKNAVFVRDERELDGAFYLAWRGQGKVPQLRGIYSWEKAAERALFFFFRVLFHKDRNGGGNGNR